MTKHLKTMHWLYRYDPLNRLISRTSTDDPDYHHFYCKGRLTTVLQGTSQHTIFQHSDLLLGQQQYQREKLKTALFATDVQRSILFALKADLQLSPLVYTPYGHCPAAITLTSLLGFNGELSEPETGHYLLGNGYREFNPVLMRFNSPDNMSPFEKGGINCYSYCEGDPINHQDPTGHILRKIFDLFRNSFTKKKKTGGLKRLSLQRTHENKFSTRRLSDPGRTPPDDQYDFIGYHGSAERHERSLTWGGVNPLFLGKGIDHIGKGFYATPDLKLATTYAFDVGGMLGGERIFSVHAKNFIGMRPGIDYIATRHRPVFENENPIQLVFREHIVSAIRIRNFDPSKIDKMVPPRYSEAPF